MRPTLFTLALALPACGSDGGSSDGTNAGDTGPGEETRTEVLASIHSNNDLARRNQALYCKLCSCGAYVDVSEAAERCESDVLDDFPEVRGVFVATLHCEIADAERRGTCLARAATCGEAEACSAPPDGATDCEALASSKAAAVAGFTAAVGERCAGQ